LLFVNHRNYKISGQKHQANDYCQLILNISLLLDLIGNIFNYAHFYNMQRTGYGILTLNVFSSIANMGANFLITCLVLLIASGWTLTYNDLGKNMFFIL